VALLAGCSHPQFALQRIRARGELRVVTLNAPTSYYLGAQGPQGFEYRLASAFARQLQVTLVMSRCLMRRPCARHWRRHAPTWPPRRSARTRTVAAGRPDRPRYDEIPSWWCSPAARAQVHAIAGLQ
jgi:ABC-type amino acid transport substrate-binding protein